MHLRNSRGEARPRDEEGRDEMISLYHTLMQMPEESSTRTYSTCHLRDGRLRDNIFTRRSIMPRQYTPYPTPSPIPFSARGRFLPRALISRKASQVRYYLPHAIN